METYLLFKGEKYNIEIKKIDTAIDYANQKNFKNLQIIRHSITTIDISCTIKLAYKLFEYIQKNRLLDKLIIFKGIKKYSFFDIWDFSALTGDSFGEPYMNNDVMCTFKPSTWTIENDKNLILKYKIEQIRNIKI